MSNSEETMMMSTDQDMFDMEDVDHPHRLSRLSMCNTSLISPHKQQEEEEEDDDNGRGGDGGMAMYMSRLSIESFDGDADEEFSDEKEGQHLLVGGLSSDSDKENQMAECYSLPGTPRPAQRKKSQLMATGIVKEYASENEVVEKGLLRKKMSRRNRVNRRRMVTRGEKWEERGSNWDNSTNTIAMESGTNTNNISYSTGESDQQGGGLLVITRPKGGGRTLCMDMEEVKACNDLGFELEHERMLDIPSGISLSASTLDTSSGGNSPMASWRISSPGDDPRDVKARLKVWAQAVAIASTSGHSG